MFQYMADTPRHRFYGQDTFYKLDALDAETEQLTRDWLQQNRVAYYFSPETLPQFLNNPSAQPLAQPFNALFETLKTQGFLKQPTTF